MSKFNFKVGDKVRVVDNQCSGCWDFGHEGYILQMEDSYCTVSDAIGGEATCNWYLYEDLEPVKDDWDVKKDSEQGFTISGLDANTTYTFRAEGTRQDNVNHPSHYGQGTIEAIEYIEDFLTEEEYIGYLRGNIAKYMHRFRYKNGVEDLKKAQWYLSRLVERSESKEE